MSKSKFSGRKRLLNYKPQQIQPIKKQMHSLQPLHTYFLVNHSLKPPYSILIDTNFINHTIRRKLDLHTEMLRCLYSNYNLYVTECVIAELEKLGRPYRVALNILKNPKYIHLMCDHKGTYVDDCIVERVTSHRCYIVATCDTELKQRIRKIPSVPIMYVKGMHYDVEGLPNGPIR
ncbi:Fcf1-like rRNA-processing protein [Hamiltosporidium magnivora]|uniref:Fcf1-like rRNA-processing protein n=1 Tax=Hamiltosporidium magnivora TaxID=148818 RepID=A0A4Q9L434_9MICR|nr:Fcf1-like rRNA-processing protein [Hamiltosporidium magnivora]